MPLVYIPNAKFRKLSHIFFLFSKLFNLLKYSEKQRWSPQGGPWPRGRSRGHILKSLALASKPQVLENCPVLGSRTALFFEQLKFRWKTPETSQKIYEHLFCFPQLEHRRRQGEVGSPPPNCNFTNDKNVTKSPLFLQFQLLSSIFY